jgi:hypothetical protein
MWPVPAPAPRFFPGISPAGLNRLRVDLYAADTRGRGGHPLAEGRLFGTGR